MTESITSRDVMADDHSLRLYESGSGNATPVLWLHGSGPGVTAMANWRGLLTELAPEFYNIAPDVLGFGDSACPDPFPPGMMASVDLRAKNTLALLDALQVESPHVVGNSMGGIIAIRMAQMAPSRLRKIVLMGSAGNGGLAPDAVAKSGAFAADATIETMRDLLRMFVYDEAQLGLDLDALAAERLEIATRPDIARVAAALVDPNGSALNFTPEDLGQILHQVLVVHGREDRVLPLERSYYLAQHLPNAQLHVFPRSGHWAHWEQQGRFKALLRAFFQDAL
ncbi:Pimeloyl-ACP methyl ester carboxylesterase [Prauserella aidingensis]|uniref:alpha/beta fold hydrolase n=1 Tax=Prauserella aidingensis TaxID=387890 RepID=UPI0020A457BD|nr:alpha/beta fold hydrolase [Prauserella aidingensis]MCP2256264.1 Pimeloyl-ACP methyl ester carboxylesterase [Prauserella aidingensis]